jgi:ankyrin repeat protein
VRLKRKYALTLLLIRITPLHAACRHGDLASVQALLNALASDEIVNEVISTRDQEGSTSLHTAAVSGDVGVIAHLLRVSADVNATDAIGSTPLHAAAESGHVVAIEVLVAAGADPNARNTLGNTPLHRAARRGLADAVEALCKLGADPV